MIIHWGRCWKPDRWFPLNSSPISRSMLICCSNYQVPHTCNPANQLHNISWQECNYCNADYWQLPCIIYRLRCASKLFLSCCNYLASRKKTEASESASTPDKWKLEVHPRCVTCCAARACTPQRLRSPFWHRTAVQSAARAVAIVLEYIWQASDIVTLLSCKLRGYWN